MLGLLALNGSIGAGGADKVTAMETATLIMHSDKSLIRYVICVCMDGGPNEYLSKENASTGRSTNIVLMLEQRLRRWPSINTALIQRLVFAGQQPTRLTKCSLMLGRRLRRWPSIVPTLVQRLAEKFASP